tara:strand:+ start:215 stop:1171 length:957 start_codon:yes stop_codon:yes gene_type:complete
MGRFFCDYCDVYLTHDSFKGRSQHCYGWKHRENYFQKFGEKLDGEFEDDPALLRANKIWDHMCTTNSKVPMPPLPEDWTEEEDPTNRRPYYVWSVTNTRTWVHPRLAEVPPQQFETMEGGYGGVGGGPPRGHPGMGMGPPRGMMMMPRGMPPRGMMMGGGFHGGRGPPMGGGGFHGFPRGMPPRGPMMGGMPPRGMMMMPRGMPPRGMGMPRGMPPRGMMMPGIPPMGSAPPPIPAMGVMPPGMGGGGMPPRPAMGGSSSMPPRPAPRPMMGRGGMPPRPARPAFGGGKDVSARGGLSRGRGRDATKPAWMTKAENGG